jgi:endonuclease III
MRPAMPPKKTKITAREQKRRVQEILRRFAEAYPDAHCALNHRNPLELLVATILSAQCTDERVNVVTRSLFEKYRCPKDYAEARPEELERDIWSTGFYHNKARSIQGAGRMILESFGDRVPDTMPELLQLPGVARKTANVVLGVAFGKAEGIVVDTHVFRVSRRLELTTADVPEKVEADLMELISQPRWISFSHEAIFHGRRVCVARKPLCPACPVNDICRSDEKVLATAPPSPAARNRKPGAKKAN